MMRVCKQTDNTGVGHEKKKAFRKTIRVDTRGNGQ
jgi:hypothetical protein